MSKAIFKVIGLYEVPSNMVAILKSQGLKEEADILQSQKEIVGGFSDQYEKRLAFYKGYFYPEFRNLLFMGKAERSVITLQKFQEKHKPELLWFLKGENKYEVKLTRYEAFLFNDKQRTVLASIQVEVDEASIEKIADLAYLIKGFRTKIITQNQEELEWGTFFSQKFLFDSSQLSNKAEAYSGSKFKVYSVIESANDLDHKKRMSLLYDIGCGVPLGSAAGQTPFSPSNEYFSTISENKISVFRNWDALPLFDTFTVIGNKILDESYKVATYTDIYFRIYVFNVYFKFCLYRFSSLIEEKSSRVSRVFDEFLSDYNLSYISFNFLPNLIYAGQRKALNIDEELILFETRANRITQVLAEKAQKRSNFLLGLISLLAGVGSIDEILSGLNKANAYLHIEPKLFYSLLIILIMMLTIPLLKYLFPNEFRIVKYWILKRIK